MTPSIPSPEFLALQDAIRGRFSLEREVGRGGMGIVFLARDVALERPVAIKLLPRALARNGALRQRFLLEARTAAGLSHPHIVPVHAVEESGELVWFVMSFIAGESLGDRIRREGALPVADVVRIGREAGWALAYAHRGGVVHRDVKPDNLFLEHGTGRVLLGDFGIARTERAGDGGRSGEGVVMGTARVMSPEQGAGEAIDGRSDLYSLGVTLFVALTGWWPFDAPSAAAILAQHAGTAAPDVRVRRPDCPALLAETIARCLCKAPAERYPSADAVVESLGMLDAPPAITAPAVDAFVDQLKAFENESGLAASIVTVLAVQALGEAVGQSSLGGLFTNVAGYAGFLATGVIAWRGVQIVHRARALVRQGLGFGEVRRAIIQRDASAAPNAFLSGSRNVSPVEPSRARWSRVGQRIAGLAALAAGSAVWWKAWHWWMQDSRGIFVDGKLYAGLTLIPIALLRWGVPRLVPRDAAGQSRWARWWSGAVGRLLFRAVGARDATAPATSLAADAPTEVALGASIASLLRALPAARQHEFGDIKSVVARLEREGIKLRAEGASLREHPAEGARYEEVAERRRTVIAAIESVRLDLLRMTANDADDGAVTRALEEANEIARRVDAALGDHLDVTPGHGTTR